MDEALAWSTSELAGATVVVTGGAGGVGSAITRAYLAADCTVIICGRNTPPPANLPRALTQAGEERRANFVVADVREPEGARAVVNAAMEQTGRLDICINNAGGSPEASAATLSPRFAQAIISLNLTAAFLVSQAANEVMQTQALGGLILNIASVSGIRPSPGTAIYGAAKAGLISLSQTLAVEWAPKVRVNCIAAGILDTGAASDHYGGPAGVEAIASTIPAGRLGTPDDIAGLCLLLSSPLASYVSGANLVAHGGGEAPAFLAAVERFRGTTAP